MGIFWSIYTLDNSELCYVDSLVCSLEFQEELGEMGICVEECVSGRNLPSLGYGDLVIFLEWVGNS